MPDKCAIRWCKSSLPGTVEVTVEGAFGVDICVNCAGALKLKPGDALPEAEAVKRVLSSPPRREKEEEED